MAVDRPTRTTTTPNHKMTLWYINEAFLHNCVLTPSHTIGTEAISTQESPTIGENPCWFFSGNPLMTPPGSILHAVTNAIRCHWIPQSNTWRVLAQHKTIFLQSQRHNPQNPSETSRHRKFPGPPRRKNAPVNTTISTNWRQNFNFTRDHRIQPTATQEWTRKLGKAHPMGTKVGAELTSQQAVTTRGSVCPHLLLAVPTPGSTGYGAEPPKFGLFGSFVLVCAFGDAQEPESGCTGGISWLLTWNLRRV